MLNILNLYEAIKAWLTVWFIDDEKARRRLDFVIDWFEQDWGKVKKPAAFPVKLWIAAYKKKLKRKTMSDRPATPNAVFMSVKDQYDLYVKDCLKSRIFAKSFETWHRDKYMKTKNNGGFQITSTHDTENNDFVGIMGKLYKEWKKETGRSGVLLRNQSVYEFFTWANDKIEKF